jgi:hypothetical protein
LGTGVGKMADVDVSPHYGPIQEYGFYGLWICVVGWGRKTVTVFLRLILWCSVVSLSLFIIRRMVFVLFEMKIV